MTRNTHHSPMRWLTLLVFFFALLWSSAVHAQTYVRPSKGVPFLALTFDAAGTTCTYPDGTSSPGCQTKALDMSAFEEIEVQLRGATTGVSMSFPMRFRNLPPFSALGVSPYAVSALTGSSVYIIALYGASSRTTAVGVYDLVGPANYVEMGTPAQNIQMYITGIPFRSATLTQPQQCGALSRHDATNIQNDGGYVAVTYRWANYVVVTNSAQNSSGNVKCRSDGRMPVMALGNPGDYLTSGQSIKYATSLPILCVSDVGGVAADGGGVWVSSFECL